MEKNWARLADAKRRRATEGPLRPYRNHPLPQQVPERFHGMHPIFGSACGAPPGHPTAKMNEIRQRTHVASRPAGVLGVFGPVKRRKSIHARNATKFGVRALSGHCSTWKKMEPFWRKRRREVRPRVHSGHTETTAFNTKCLSRCTETTQLLAGPVGPHPGTPREK